MKFTLEPVSGPEIEPVTLAEAKTFLGEFAGVTARDAEILDLIQAGREWLEDYTGRVCIDQTWRLNIEQAAAAEGTLVAQDKDWASDGILLGKSPVLAIESFVTLDAAGAETVVDPASFQLVDADSKWPRVVAVSGATWTTGRFRITFRAGYADQTGSPQQGADVVPARLRQSIKLHVEANYNRNPDTMETTLKAAENLAKPERCNLQFA